MLRFLYTDANLTVQPHLMYCLETRFKKHPLYSRDCANRVWEYTLLDEKEHTIENRNPQVIRYLIDQGMVGEDDYSLSAASMNGYLGLVQVLIEQHNYLEDGDSLDYALETASAVSHNSEMVCFLVESGANVRTNEDCALRWASLHCDMDLVRFLVKRGANIHVFNDYPLRASCKRGRLEQVRFLVDHGADIHALDDHAFLLAVLNSHIDIARFLLERGANIHARDDDAFLGACEVGSMAMVRFLVENGANIHVDNDRGIQIARWNCHTEVSNYIYNLYNSKTDDDE